jgi:hypothetical protein
VTDIKPEDARADERPQKARDAANELIDALNDKGQRRFRDMARKLATLAALDSGDATNILFRAEQDANRIINRRTAPADMERVEIAQTFGPTIEFTGAQLYEETFTDNGGRALGLELFSTLSGSFVVVQDRTDPHGFQITSADVIDDADPLKVMDACKYSSMARTMAKKMGWSLRVEVE